MSILKRIKHSLLTRHGVFEISSDNGLISIYALRRARGEGGKPDPKLEALLARNAQKLKEKQEWAMLVKQCRELLVVTPPCCTLSLPVLTDRDLPLVFTCYQAEPASIHQGKNDFDGPPVPPASTLKYGVKGTDEEGEPQPYLRLDCHRSGGVFDQGS